MYKRLPVLVLCLTVAALGTSACDDSGDNRSGAPAPAAPAAASSPAGASSGGSEAGPQDSPQDSAPASPSADPAKPRQLTGLLSKLYLKTIRDNYPNMASISDETLIDHGNAFCAAQGVALADQAKKTMKELGTTPKQTAQIMGSAHGYCR
ncbi:hypothetical protein [Streptomyces sp. URMC 123]|uniref:hypothetical protein n=1 Tax=Streptomyces sp. URMC 123 TaxID=3423403 RepID=UPI003F1D020F